MIEHDLGDGHTVIIEWSETWQAYVGTITDTNGRSAGTILRDTVEACLEGASQTVNRKG